MKRKGLERIEAKDIIPEPEKKAMDKYLRDLDQRTIDDIQHRFGSYIPEGRLDRIRRVPANFLDHKEYDKHLRKEGVEVKEGNRVLGDVGDGVYVDRNHTLVPKTLAHERLHQVSDKLYRSTLGARFDEGTTEYFASQVRSDLNLSYGNTCYPREVRVMEMLSARVGDGAVAKAYFRGDWIGLQKHVDKQLGDGALAEISSLVEQQKYKEAEEVITGT